MLRLTRTAIGLLTRQYRSVLKKCWAINVGIFALGAVATTILPSDAYAGYTDGYGNTASGESSSAIGQYNTATGILSSVFGYASQAFGFGSSAFGYLAQAGNPSDDTVTNTVTTNSKERYATAVGSYVQATGLYALALGNQKVGMTKTTASGQSAIAIGTGAQATHDNSVAIGTNSVSAGENTISVGNSTTKRKIVNVAEGADANDAVTVSQLGNIAAGTKILNPNGTSAISFGTNTGQITVGTAIAHIANELDNNYYRKDKKSEILGGFEAGKIGNENDDNFSQLVANDNFAITTFLRAI